VEAFVAHGASRVYAAVRNLSNAKPLAEEYPDKVVPIYVDLGKPESIIDAATIAQDATIVINNAATISYTPPLAEDALTQIQTEMQVNVYGLMQMAQSFAPILKANGGGIFCQMNATSSLRSMEALSTYAASKAASFSLTQALRATLGEQGTHVLSVHPGPVLTGMIASRTDLNIAEVATPEQIALAIIESMEAKEFLCYPDDKAKSLGQVYRPFSDYVFEEGNTY